MSSEAHNRRQAREKRTIERMVAIYCRDEHGNSVEICRDCRQLLDYALERLDKCKLLPDKPTCAQCPVHCFNPAMRTRIRDVMHYTGPRMMLRHPGLALCHMLDGLKRVCRRSEERTATEP